MPEERIYDPIKHLEFIQNAITRMAQNSFMCKGWAIAIMAALIAFDSARVPREILISAPVLAIVVLLSFWFLDSYYLRLERLFRKLYDDVRKNDYSHDPYTMDFSAF
jgi:glucan phosphoethanolaminetransferase (alkaline phosphatase superfamily)